MTVEGKNLTLSPLFRGFDAGEITDAIACLKGRTIALKKGEPVYRIGEPVDALGILLSGGIALEKEDYWGNRMVLGHVEPGQIIGEVYACLGGEPMDVWAVTDSPSEVLLLPIARLTDPEDPCPYSRRLTANLLRVLSHKALNLTRKIEHSTQRTIRKKVMSYLSEQARRAKSPRFTIPYNRQALADYLGVDRSALSAELSRMQRDGLIAVKGSHFELLAEDDPA
jgi:CRP-like cAMP-binding protein